MSLQKFPPSYTSNNGKVTICVERKEKLHNFANISEVIAVLQILKHQDGIPFEK